MADGELMLASAVVIPDAPDLASASPSTNSPTILKRRQSETSDLGSSKRPRFSPDSDHDPVQLANGHSARSGIADGAKSPPQNPSPRDDPPSRTGRKQTGRDEERKRGQRLFGALLGTLSASGARRGAGVQQKRQDIEKRTQAKLQQIHEDNARRKKDDVERVLRRRKREHWVVQKQALETRHGNMRSSAQHLYTVAEPRLYYRPWELSKDDEEQIARQVDEAEEQIEQENASFDDQRRRALEELDGLDQQDSAKAAEPSAQHEAEEIKMASSEPSKETNETRSPVTEEDTNTRSEPMDEPAAVEATKAPSPEQMDVASPADVEQEEMDEHHGETVVEAEEDTVIY